MNHSSLSQSILSKIKEQHIAPKPHWHFILKNILFWSVFGLSVFFGARALGVVIFIITDLRPELLAQSRAPLVPHFLQIIPLFWLVLFITTILIAVLGLHHTKKGYTVSIPKIIGVNILATLILGLGFFALGDSEKFEQKLSKHLPIQTPEIRRTRVWNTPIEGRLAGQVQKENDDANENSETVITVIDLTGKTWHVDMSNIPEAQRNFGPHIRMVGKQTGESTFTVDRIYPWAHLPQMRPPKFRQSQEIHYGSPPIDGPPPPRSTEMRQPVRSPIQGPQPRPEAQPGEEMYGPVPGPREDLPPFREPRMPPR